MRLFLLLSVVALATASSAEIYQPQDGAFEWPVPPDGGLPDKDAGEMLEEAVDRLAEHLDCMSNPECGPFDGGPEE